jgi:hypothetical protein
MLILEHYPGETRSHAHNPEGMVNRFLLNLSLSYSFSIKSFRDCWVDH